MKKRYILLLATIIAIILVVIVLLLSRNTRKEDETTVFSSSQDSVSPSLSTDENTTDLEVDFETADAIDVIPSQPDSPESIQDTENIFTPEIEDDIP